MSEEYLGESFIMRSEGYSPLPAKTSPLIFGEINEGNRHATRRFAYEC
jgi:hypothetical protein